MRLRPVLFALLVTFFGCVAAAAGLPQVPGSELVLRPGDAVRVQVSDEPPPAGGPADQPAHLMGSGLSGVFEVGVDGDVLVPLLGAVAVAGRPFGEVQADLLSGYERELAGQAVRATPLLRIPVVGEVRAPGLYTVDPTYRLDELLALAGGLTQVADVERVRVIGVDGSTNRLAERAPESAGSFAFRSGDRVVVGRQGWLRQNASILIGAAASVTAAAVTALLLR